MSTLSLIRRLDRLDHSERISELVSHVRRISAKDAALLQTDLMGGDPHWRRLGLVVATARRDLGPAWAALDDPSISVRFTAARIIGRMADTIPTTVVARIDTATLAPMLRQVVRRRRPAMAEALVDALCEAHRLREAVVVLSACSDAFVEARLGSVPWPEPVWARLAEYRPAAVVAHVERAFELDLERPDFVWRRYAPSVWIALSRRRPEAVASWVERFADAVALPTSLAPALPELVRWSAARVVGWLGARPAWVERHGLPAGLARRARDLDAAVLVPLCIHLARGAPGLLAELLRHSPYPRRTTLFHAATEPLDLARIEWPPALLAVLPAELRDREAARMLGLRRAREHASWRRELLGYRTIEQARPELEAEGRAAQAEDRAEAHAALVRSTGRSRRGMPETLAWLQRIRNEQDPVRHAVLTALAELPGHLHADPVALDEVVAPIFTARDTSYATRHAAAKLATRIMTAQAASPRSPMFAFAVSLLSRLAGQAGTLDLPALHPNLPRGAEQGIVDALLPWLEADRKRQLEPGIVRLWHALGKRAWRVTELADLLERIVWKGKKSFAPAAAACWIADPKTRDERVRALVERDPSALYLHGVFAHCHRRRQTLLQDRFAARPPKGRFHDGKVAVVPTVGSGLTRWPPKLMRRYLDLVTHAENEPRQHAWSRASLVAMRARVPLTQVDDLGYALRSKDVVVQEAALGALVWIDQPGPALPILLEHLDSDRARVAMYAMPRLARLLPGATVVEALATLLARPKLRITVHKEVLRLLGQCGTEAAVELLRGAWAAPVHRDVRIAAIHAARSCLGRPEAWTLLSEAATAASPDIARAIVEVPLGNVAQAHRARYLAIMAHAADHPDPTARAALFGALEAGWSTASPAQAVELAARVIGRLDLLDPWRTALRVIADGSRSHAAHPPIGGLVDGLRDAAIRDVAPAGERDQIAMQRLLEVIAHVASQRHPTTAVLLRSLAESLLAVPILWEVGVAARVAAATEAELASTVAELLAASATPRSSIAVERAAASAASDTTRQWTTEQAGQVVDLLLAGPPGTRVVASAMVAAFGPRWAWTDTWVGRLRRLREDPDLDVRSAARRVWITIA
jgi:hypothetical protein